MSLLIPYKIQCVCGRDFIHEIYDSVNVTVDPHLRYKIIKGDLNVVTCPNCKVRITIEKLLIYHDMDSKLMIWVYPEWWQDREKELKKEMEKEIAEAMNGLPSKLTSGLSSSEYRFQMLFGMESLVNFITNPQVQGILPESQPLEYLLPKDMKPIKDFDSFMELFSYNSWWGYLKNAITYLREYPLGLEGVQRLINMLPSYRGFLKTEKYEEILYFLCYFQLELLDYLDRWSEFVKLYEKLENDPEVALISLYSAPNGTAHSKKTHITESIRYKYDLTKRKIERKMAGGRIRLHSQKPRGNILPEEYDHYRDRLCEILCIRCFKILDKEN